MKTFVDRINIGIKILVLTFLIFKSVLQSSQKLSKMKSREYTFSEAASQDIERLFDNPTPQRCYGYPRFLEIRY